MLLQDAKRKCGIVDECVCDHFDQHHFQERVLRFGKFADRQVHPQFDASVDSEITEESEVTSPLDKVSELVVLLDTMKALANDAATYEAVWCQLSQQVQQQYQELAANCTQILQRQQQMAQLQQQLQHWGD